MHFPAVDEWTLAQILTVLKCWTYELDQNIIRDLEGYLVPYSVIHAQKPFTTIRAIFSIFYRKCKHLFIDIMG